MNPQEHIFCLYRPSSPWRNFWINLLNVATRYPVTQVALRLCDIPHKKPPKNLMNADCKKFLCG